MSEGGKQPIIIKKVKKISGGHHGGAWKVAYADFVTAMMAFFLLLWLLNMTSPEKKIQISYYFRSYSVFGKSGSGMFDADIIKTVDNMRPAKPRGLPEATKPGPGGKDPEKGQEKAKVDSVKRMDIMKEVYYGIQDAGLGKEVSIVVTPTGLKIRLPSFLLFEEGRAVLKPDEKARELLPSIATLLKKLTYETTIEGHTDNQQLSTKEFASNWELSSGRALSVLKYFEGLGCTPRYMRAMACGEYRPIEDNGTLLGRKLNRRVDIDIDMTQSLT